MKNKTTLLKLKEKIFFVIDYKKNLMLK